jgi:hypothetical protein
MRSRYRLGSGGSVDLQQHASQALGPDLLIRSSVEVEASRGTGVRMLPVGPKHEQSQAEEVANSISYDLGLIAALVGVPLLIVHAPQRGDAAFIIGASDTFCGPSSQCVCYRTDGVDACTVGWARIQRRTSCNPYMLLSGPVHGAWRWSRAPLCWAQLQQLPRIAANSRTLNRSTRQNGLRVSMAGRTRTAQPA